MSVKITMIGTGYVGLVTGACFAELGHDVICVDTDQAKIDRIKAGDLPIYEQGLEELVQQNVDAGRLRFSTSTAESSRGRDVIFLAVGTPSERNSGRADLQYVYSAAEEVGRAIDQFTVLVTKSTVPVGTNRTLHDRLLHVTKDAALFAVGSNPEFLREGVAIRDFMEPDRVVIGSEDDRAIKVLERVYAPLTSRGVPLLATNIETAEMIKYAANAFLAIKVSYINEISDLCEVIGADVRSVAQGIGLDHRIGASFLRPGPGWGGSCFPKDTRALLNTARDVAMPCKIVEAAVTINETRKHSMVDRIRQLCGGSLAGKRIGVLGVTFKGQTDDMRESPSLEILPVLVEEGAVVSAFDPSKPRDAATLLPMVDMRATALEAAADADLLVVLTDWMIFRSYQPSELAKSMRRPVMLDLRNLFSHDQIIEAGFSAYHGLGHGEVVASAAAAPLREVAKG